MGFIGFRNGINERLIGFNFKRLKPEEVQITKKSKFLVDTCFYLKIGYEFSVGNLAQ